MNYTQIKKIADKYLNKFSPLCDRIEIAGSIRREKSMPDDIELLCIPKVTTAAKDMFEDEEIRDPEFVKLVNSFNRTRGNGEGKYAQLILPEGCKLDLFICNKNNWGLIMMIRTGSAWYSQRIVTEIKDRGYKSEGGFLKDLEGNIVSCPEEDLFYKITNTPWTPPHLRIF